MYILNQFAHTLYKKRLFIWNLIVNSMQIYPLQRVSQVKKCSNFLTLLTLKGKWELYWKSHIGWEKMSETTKNAETEYATIEDHLSMIRISSNKSIFIFAIFSKINEEKSNMASKKIQFQFLVIIFVKSKHFLIFFLKGKFDCNASRDFSLTPSRYFN